MCVVYLAYTLKKDVTKENVRKKLEMDGIVYIKSLLRPFQQFYELLQIQSESQQKTGLLSIGLYKKIYTEEIDQFVENRTINMVKQKEYLEKRKELMLSSKQKILSDCNYWISILRSLCLLCGEVGILYSYDENFIMEEQIPILPLNLTEDVLLKLKPNSMLIISS